MKLQPRQQTITIQILPNISKSKSKRTMKFDQLVEYNQRNIFLQKSCRKSSRETLVELYKSYLESSWSAS